MNLCRKNENRYGSGPIIYLVVDESRYLLINWHIIINGSFELMSQMVENHFKQLMIVVGAILDKIMITVSVFALEIGWCSLLKKKYENLSFAAQDIWGTQHDKIYNYLYTCLSKKAVTFRIQLNQTNLIGFCVKKKRLEIYFIHRTLFKRFSRF